MENSKKGKPKSFKKVDLDDVIDERVEEKIEEMVDADARDGVINAPTSNIKSYNEDDGEYKINVIQDYYGGIDITYLTKKDPKFAYRFLRDEKSNLTTKMSNIPEQRGGWQLCSRKHCVERLGINETEISPDGLYRVGADLVLAFMPKEIWERKEKYKKEQANAPVDAVERLINEGDDSVSGVGHENMRGLQTQKSLGMK